MLIVGKGILSTFSISLAAVVEITKKTFMLIVDLSLKALSSISRFPELVAAAVTGGSAAVKTKMAEIMTDVASGGQSLVDIYTAQVSGIATAPLIGIANTAEAARQALVDANTAAGTAFDAAGGNTALQEGATALAGAVTDVGRSVTDAMGAFKEVGVEGLVEDIASGLSGIDFSGLLDPSTMTKGLAGVTKDLFGKVMERGEWFHLWGQEAINAGKVVAKEKEAMSEPVVIPMKWEWKGFDQLHKDLQEEIFGMKDKAKKGGKEIAGAMEEGKEQGAKAEGGGGFAGGGGAWGGGGAGAGLAPPVDAMKETQTKAEQDAIARQRRIDHQKKMYEKDTPAADRQKFLEKQAADAAAKALRFGRSEDRQKFVEKQGENAFRPSVSEDRQKFLDKQKQYEFSKQLGGMNLPLEERAGFGKRLPNYSAPGTVPITPTPATTASMDPMKKVLTESEKQTAIQNQMLAALLKPAPKSPGLALV